VRRLSAAIVAALALTHGAAGQWQVISSDDESSGPVVHRQLVMERAPGKERATLDLALFSTKSATLHIIDNPGGSENLAKAMSRGKYLAGVNGGYFDTDFEPIGLRMIDGETASPFIRARLLAGVLCASTGAVEIFRVGDLPRRRRFEAAIECGPFLVDGGMHVLNLNNERSARRTFAMVSREGKAALGVSSELTLGELAEALGNRSISNEFRVSRALNLDGGSSSAFWFRRNNGQVFSISEDKAVRDFVAIGAR
jgi:uncharacterized protein YigE (DUF2233 family)